MSNERLNPWEMRIEDAKSKAGPYPVTLNQNGTRIGGGNITEMDGAYYFMVGRKKPVELRVGMELHLIPDGKLPYKKFRLV